MKGKDVLSVADLDSEEIRLLISDATILKARGWCSYLDRKVLVILFEKPSLRTRMSFEVAMRQLGGEAIYLSPAEVGLGKRESAADVARVLERYTDAIAIRTFSHKTQEDLAKHSRVPVINALSDVEHPCQAFADLMTVYEKKGQFDNLTLAYIGDGNNVANSLLLACALVGMNFRIANPDGYDIPPGIMAQAKIFAAENGATIYRTTDPQEAVREADVVYTDVWTSMGQEAESEVRRKAFVNYQVDDELLSLAATDAIFMHDLPAHRGEEVTDSVIDGPQSVVFDQAENRMHVQKALLLKLLGGLEVSSGTYGN